MAAVAPYRPPIVRPLLQAADAAGRPVSRSGHMLYFFGRIVLAIPLTLGRYRREFFRNLSDIAWGNGSIVVGGGTIGVAVVLGMTAGALLAVDGSWRSNGHGRPRRWPARGPTRKPKFMTHKASTRRTANPARMQSEYGQPG
jgi:hypothetical protein